MLKSSNKIDVNTAELIISIDAETFEAAVESEYQRQKKNIQINGFRKGKVSRKLAEKHGCRFVDFQKMYEDYCKVRHSSYIAWDRIHPNQIGSALMAREFLKQCEFDYHH